MDQQETGVLITAPQFDTSKLKVGAAVSVVDYNSRTVNNSYEINALIVEASPIKLRVVYVDDDKDVDYRTISIDDVTRKTKAVNVKLLRGNL